MSTQRENLGTEALQFNGRSDLPANVLGLPPNRMHRLPGYDHRHNRPEKIVFLTLYVLGLALVTVAVSGGGSFAVHKEQICQALSSNLLVAAKSQANSTAKPGAIQLKSAPQTAGAPRRGAPES